MCWFYLWFTTRNRVFPNVDPHRQKSQNTSGKVTLTSQSMLTCTSRKARQRYFFDADRVDDGETFTDTHYHHVGKGFSRCDVAKSFLDVTSRNPSPMWRRGKPRICFLFFFFFFFSSSSSLLRSVSIAYFYYSCNFFVDFCSNLVFHYRFINAFCSALDSGSAMI